MFRMQLLNLRISNCVNFAVKRHNCITSAYHINNTCDERHWTSIREKEVYDGFIGGSDVGIKNEIHRMIVLKKLLN